MRHRYMRLEIVQNPASENCHLPKSATEQFSTPCAGICKYGAGSCAIRLSEPLLKFRSSLDVKVTLLHEMIHVYLWLTNSNQDHNDHGPSFQKMMQAINASHAVDHQRPAGGYQITIYHNFSDEVNNYRKHHWKCLRCGNLVKRAINRAPSQADCYSKIGGANMCNNEHCHWHRHQQLCGGEYQKIVEPDGFMNRRLRARKSDIHSKESRSSSEAHVTKEPSRKQKNAVDNLGTKKTKSREDSESCHLPKKVSLDKYFTPKNKLNDTEKPNLATEIEDHDELHGHISSEEETMVWKKRGRKHEVDCCDRDFCAKIDERPALALSKRQEATNSFQRVTMPTNECTVIIGWKGWYACEGEEDETDTTALKNKRSQRRMSERVSSQMVNNNDVICADCPGDRIQDPVALSKETVGSEEAVGKNAIPLEVIPVDDSSSSPTDLGAASHTESVDLVMLGHKSSFVKRDWHVGEVSSGSLVPEELSAGVSVYADHMTLIDHGDCAAAVSCNMQGGLPVTLNKNDQGATEENAHKSLEAEHVFPMAEVSEIKTTRKARSKRRREEPGRSNVTLQKGEPLPVCPICGKALAGNIEDASFNTKLNQHIDASIRECCPP
ncbi:hypothetical protein L7F22_064153 [Adiantum nelumboides]|nr:hypothetical protein [Adiantum nelumboides]